MLLTGTKDILQSEQDCSTKCILLYITIYHEIRRGYGSGAWLWTIWHHYYECIVIILYILFAYAVSKLASNSYKVAIFMLKRQPCRRGFSGLAGSESLDSAKSPLRHLFRTVGSYVRFSAVPDKDGSGYITVDELQQACAEHNMTDVLLEDIIREVDQDNDGRIDYGEFVAMVLIFSLLADCTADPEYDDS
ncbi:hypothetical protein ES332_D08G094000v1 [Gossypium tomentosum]|uniref:EF-hand domain-containing protein n=1 Tax=Gossypium tomentosum TaxID=34277 RepID=A0A5D2JST6_GOSTO|nr:hypothetical protein ES332_D08G094000v1 [Gossypium tomentosum]